MTVRYKCPCCGFLTLPEPSPGSLEICHVCRWQDDIVGFNEPDNAVGPNAVSLSEARANYRKTGVSDPARAARARPPRSDEIPCTGPDMDECAGPAQDGRDPAGGPGAGGPGSGRSASRAARRGRSFAPAGTGTGVIVRERELRRVAQAGHGEGGDVAAVGRVQRASPAAGP
jgi:hypothetical protein